MQTAHDVLRQGHQSPQGAALISPKGNYHATLRDDGSLYTYVSNHYANQNILWSSQSSNHGQGPYKLIMQDDGNLVIYDKVSKVIWASNTVNQGQAPYLLRIQEDSNLVIYDANNKVIWASNTQR